MPSPKAVQEFKELFFQRYGVHLSDAEALEQAGRLLRLYKAVYGANAPKEDHDKEI
jgi:hypothetical protein